MSDAPRKRPPPPEDLDENPVWTEDMHARARPASEVHGEEVARKMVRKQGRPKLPQSERKQPVSIRLSPDVLEELRATGEGWQTRVDDVLRAVMRSDVGNPTEAASEIGRAIAVLKTGDAKVGEHIPPNDNRAAKASARHPRPTLFERMAHLSRLAAEREEAAGAKDRPQGGKKSA